MLGGRRMEREGPNVRPARLDFPESGGGWAILGISYDALLHARWLREQGAGRSAYGTRHIAKPATCTTWR